jgi:predicted unusual protein kinase regulating ubiquinone biosynthesis (AarF/ABC1/UbiB family)
VDLAASLLTPGNAEMLARRLAVLRGPAMKLGQLISLSGEELVPEEFRRALDVLRSQGYSMPDSQLRRVLGREYGKGWQDKFAHFDFEPVAAASIGQIHRARKHGGRELALKIQYPGVARSVDSDVDNLATLLRRLDFLPLQLDVPALASEAKRQLKLETDYESEARHLERYRKLVAVMPDVVVPRVDRTLTTRHVLAMDWIDGEPLEALASEAVPQARRNAVARTLYELMFRELFEFRFVQTDPNFANYLYLPATHQVALLDLGSAGEYPAALVGSYRDACRALLADDEHALREAIFAIGYAHPDDPEPMIRNAADIIRLACEPLAHRGPYDFAASGLAFRARDLGLAVAFGKGLRSPPPATMFLHRKLIGTFLICARLRARVNVHAVIEKFL